MTESHEPPTDALHDEAHAEAHEEPWNPPATLPPPPAAGQGRFPLEAFGLALAVSIGCGVALWGLGQAIYIWILCNTLIGSAVGWALGLAPKRAGFTSLPALVGAAALFCAIPYVVMRYGFYLQALPDLRAGGYEGGFLPIFIALVEARTVFGAELGLIGNVLVLLAEVGLSIYVAYGSLQKSLAEARIAQIPEQVLVFIVNGLGHDWDTDRIRAELTARGWTRPEDQERAIGSAFDLVAAINARAQAG